MIQLYFLIDPITGDILEIDHYDLEIGEYNDQESSLVNGKPFLVPAVVTEPEQTSETQIIEGPINTWDGTDATSIYTIREKTLEELATESNNQDIALILDKGKDITLVLVELVDYLLTNTAMSATDFTPNVRQAYLDIKVIADRLKSNT